MTPETEGNTGSIQAPADNPWQLEGSPATANTQKLYRALTPASQLRPGAPS